MNSKKLCNKAPALLYGNAQLHVERWDHRINDQATPGVKPQGWVPGSFINIITNNQVFTR